VTLIELLRLSDLRRTSALLLEPISKSIFDRHTVPEWLVLDDQATYGLSISCVFLGLTSVCLTLHVVHDVMQPILRWVLIRFIRVLQESFLEILVGRIHLRAVSYIPMNITSVGFGRI
jgi:hypothetical protein